ncbi:helix-turn-helix domain-containing protein [Dermatobacter hominis]|uniref:helix-turn-helix domain-containing protein n=1 Tax=Dermatobacter hominis TaxID=2884263 RepID=UPI001D106591|nr:helix-turn-helix domain-containing protein [Dermatobacter hominis]UDY34405.1 helix-turn-helix domain-containing protein [Dermatobacter hominis]
MTSVPGRDRLRELLDALLDDEPGGLDAAADRASSSPFHFARQLSSATGEPPMSIRRRVLLERAAWQLAQGSSVTDAAFDAGYESVDGFSRAFHRAFGYPPSSAGPGLATWLPSPNGLHFHPPVNLWLTSTPHVAEGAGADGVVALMVHHDVDDTAHLIELAASLDDERLRRELAPGRTVLRWDGPEPSVAAVLEHIVWSKEVWSASIAGGDIPPRGGDAPDELRARHAAAGPRWISTVSDISRRGAWSDRFVDALCDPPESFVLSSVVAHVLEFSAHRRQVVRSMLRDLGGADAVDHGDPIDWLHLRHGPPDRAGGAGAAGCEADGTEVTPTTEEERA